MSKIIFELVLQDVNAQAAISKFRQEVKDANAEIKKGVGGDRFKELTEKVTDAKVSIFKLTEEQKKLRKEFAATQVPTDSLAGLRIAYAQVTEQVTKLTKAERESDFGKNLIQKGNGLKTQINGIEESLGRFTGNVGNYKKALLSVGDIVTGGLATGGIVVGIQAVVGVMKIGFDQAVKYEKALDDLSALTGKTGSELEGLKNIGDSLRNINVSGQEIVNTGPDILNALKLVGGARPELLENAAALGDVTKQAIILSQASGDELEPSVKALTTILGQFSLDADQSKRVINELAAGAKEGAAEIPQITDSLREFGTVAKISNVSTSESIALIEVLADRQLKGAEAGTQLRNIFSKLASADILPPAAQAQFSKLGIDINVLKDSTLPLETRLKELGKAQGDISALTKIFGLENLQAATIITSGLDKYDALTGKIVNTNQAYEQAAIRADNLSTKLENLKNGALNSLQQEFEGATAGGSILLGTLSSLTEGFDLFGKKINIVSTISDLAVGPLSVLLERINAFTDYFKTEDKPKGLQGLDVDALKSSVDLLTGEVKPAVEDTTDALLKQVNSLVELGKATEDADGKTDGLKDKTKATKKEADAAAGSIKFFQEQITALKSQLEKTDADSPLVKQLIKDITTAEKALVAVQAKIERIKNPLKAFAPKQGVDTPGEAAPVELAVAVDVAGAEDQARKDIESLATSLGNQAVTVKVTADTTDFQEGVDAAIEKNKEREAKREEVNDAIKSAALDSAQAIADGVFEIQQSQLQRETEASLEAIDEEYAKKKKAALGNVQLTEKLDKEQAKKKAAIEKAAAEKRKQLALTQAYIDLALGILKALSSAAPPFNYIFAAAVAIAGAVQIAAIKKQEFAEGGMVKKLGSGIINQPANHPATSRGDNVHVLVKSGEMILNEEQQRELKRRAGHDIFQQIGVPMHGVTSKLVPQFATGGLVQDFTPQIALPNASNSQPVVIQTIAEISDVQMDMLASRIATQTGRATKQGVGEGLEDNNRLQERQASLTANREA